MRTIQAALAEVKTIQPSAAQAVLTLLPPGTKLPSLPLEAEAGPRQAAGQGTSAVLQGQERLHQEGKAALCTLSCTREALRRAMEEELQQQRELRTRCRDFFRSVILRFCLKRNPSFLWEWKGMFLRLHPVDYRFQSKFPNSASRG